jgi:hypothetical protein
MMKQNNYLQAPSPWGDLEEVLARAATKDRTVIMTQINAAWTRPGSLFDLFFESFRTGEGGVARLLDHLVIVTMDPAAYEGCKAVHGKCPRELLLLSTWTLKMSCTVRSVVAVVGPRQASCSL